MQADEQISSLRQKMAKLESERCENDIELRKEAAEMNNKLAQTIEREKVAAAKLASSEATVARLNQKIQDLDSKRPAIEAKLTKLRSENMELVDKISAKDAEIRKLAAPNEDVVYLKTQLNSLRKQNQALTEKSAGLESRILQSEKKNGALVSQIEKYEASLAKSFECPSIEEAANKLHEALDTARFWQRENGDLRMQLAQLK